MRSISTGANHVMRNTVAIAVSSQTNTVARAPRRSRRRSGISSRTVSASAWTMGRKRNCPNTDDSPVVSSAKKATIAKKTGSRLSVYSLVIGTVIYPICKLKSQIVERIAAIKQIL